MPGFEECGVWSLRLLKILRFLIRGGSRPKVEHPFDILLGMFRNLVAEWIHFTLFGIRLPTIRLEVYTLGGL